MTLADRLSQCRSEWRGALDPADRQILARAVDRLRMLQLVELGLAVGDVLPDFALCDTDGILVLSEALLARGPLAVVFLRGPWCPYCTLALEALEEVRPAIDQLGASLVVVSPASADQLWRAAKERGLHLRLLSDPGAAYAKVCGVQYEMTEAHAELYLRLGWNVAEVNAGSGWELPVPATYVAGSDGVIGYAFADADWSYRAEPADILGAIGRLAGA